MDTPIACSLTADDLGNQRERWHALAHRALAERTETEHGLRISFHERPGVENELRALAAVETECCAWATWTVETAAGKVVLDARSTGEGVATLHGMLRLG